MLGPEQSPASPADRDTAERRTPETGTQMREGEQDVGDQDSVESESSAEWREGWGRRPQTSLSVLTPLLSRSLALVRAIT